jgi:hypothetical protein
LKKWFLALAICAIGVTVSIAAVIHFASQTPEQYFLTLQHQWKIPPLTSTTANFTITGKQWYVDWNFASYSLISSSMDLSVQNASTNALVEHVTLTNEQRRAYFDVKGTFYLSLRLNNTTDLGQPLILVNIWELR